MVIRSRGREGFEVHLAFKLERTLTYVKLDAVTSRSVYLSRDRLDIVAVVIVVVLNEMTFLLFHLPGKILLTGLTNYQRSTFSFVTRLVSTMISARRCRESIISGLAACRQDCGHVDYIGPSSIV
ncbi:hypothetical protein E2C01_041682 [Portunus trituberculatus]|uniref:Uncharacterized protein n=1 Tax=Portunus trituberculatus TaxID=210409 RepID=A0A5B7FKJ6_PORTR|nr:hypothetical protein [Portunus trituberculatus]